MQYNIVALGGTFDHFHAGHEQFIATAAKTGLHLIIGITTSELVDHKPFAELIESYEVRTKGVEAFCIAHGISYEIVQLQDSVGPAVTDSRIEAVCVTSNTRAGGEYINTLRKQQGKSLLPIIEVPLVLDAGGTPIASERIRSGVVNRDGIVFTKLLEHEVHLTETMRAQLSTPQGPLVAIPDESDHRRIVVGDTSLEKFIAQKWVYDWGFYDLRKMRREYEAGILHTLAYDAEIYNKHGTVSRAVLSIFKTLSWGKVYNVLIVGEEDLIAVAAVLYAPLDTAIYYGQPNTGLIRMLVTEELKLRIYRLLNI